MTSQHKTPTSELVNHDGARVWFLELFAGSGHVTHIAQRVLQLPAARCITLDVDPGITLNVLKAMRPGIITPVQLCSICCPHVSPCKGTVQAWLSHVRGALHANASAMAADLLQEHAQLSSPISTSGVMRASCVSRQAHLAPVHGHAPAAARTPCGICLGTSLVILRTKGTCHRAAVSNWTCERM